ncbi:sensor histidine kinase [Solimicrobium silvestre]|uniref:histidine kinase n=1 Tax=Solimicrobium silvestre TaxID=2099400 RepID=A0A2S9H021_9BURK|nr:ATP-binding protein [Solimicrobium silvestre]PRC93317.1 Signal transduction histidine kinase involved in nitrogen fixation and metabolism regulation [Solimicrobium silvestre]
MTRLLRYLFVVGAAVTGIFLFLIASLSDQTAVFEKNYIWLFGLNSLVAIALLALIVLLLTRLYRRYKKKEFGTRLLTRLVILFATLAIVPGALIYAVSIQFVSRSIESGFDARVENAIDAGLNLGRSALDNSLSELTIRAHRSAQELADLSGSNRVIQLSRLFEQNQQLEATIVTGRGQLVSSTGGQFSSLLPDMPTQAMLRQARNNREFSDYEGGNETSPDGSMDGDGGNELTPKATQQTGIRLRVLVLIPNNQDSLSLHEDPQYLQLIQPIPESIRINTDKLASARSKYQELAAGRTILRKIYIATLTLTLLLAIFASIVSAFLLATDLIKPILLLAEGTKAVTQGNLSPRPIIASSDELGSLTKSFNIMTHQLFDARATVEKNRSELQNAKAYLESVLANMSAGVMVLDRSFHLVTCNESVERILQLPLENYIGQPLIEIPGLSTFAHAIAKAFSEHNAQSAAGDNADQHWQQQIELPRHLTGEQDSGFDFGEMANNNQTITLLARGSHLPVSSGTGNVVVFDDITNIISAQRSIAWGEVGRRLAHEIKNPLTPIQLSAERLQMKLHDKLNVADAAILSKSTATIVNQVSSMKRMVDDFRDYARTPPAHLTPLNLNGLIDEVMNLYIGGDGADVIRMKLSTDLPTIMGDATQLRQVIHNLLQNAQDSVNEQHGNSPDRQIDVITEVVHYNNSEGEIQSAASLSIIDNGVGFSSKILARAFEPYATSKPRGTGLGLAVVKKILEEHGGRVDIKNRTDGNGAKVAILLLKLAPNN